MKRLPTLLATFLAAVVGLTAFAWVRAGQDRYAGLEAEARALARLLKSAALDAAKTLEGAEQALAGRLAAAARRADAELDRSPRPAGQILGAVAADEHVGRIFLFDEGKEVVAWARYPAVLPDASDGALPRMQLDEIEAAEAARAITAMAPSAQHLVSEGFQTNPFGTRDRFGVAYGRLKGGSLLLRADVDELAYLRRRFGIEAVLDRIREVPGVVGASLEKVSIAGRRVSVPDAVNGSVSASESFPLPGGDPIVARVALDRATADLTVGRSRSSILIAGCLACAVAVGAVLLLRSRERRAEREKADLAERKDEDRRLAEAGALASLFAHEISNPLNSIRLGLRLLDGEGSAEEAESVLATIRSESGRMAASLEGFLALAQGRGTGRDALDPSLLDDVARNVEAHAARRRVHLDRRVAADAPTATGSRPVIEQALTSLVRNAIEASPQEASVKIAWVRDKDGGVLVTVEDHGPGFPPGDRSELLRLGRSRREGGHGLGLPLAERFVAAHGGTLSLEDADGGGARVEVRLPAAHGKMDA